MNIVYKDEYTNALSTYIYTHIWNIYREKEIFDEQKQYCKQE